MLFRYVVAMNSIIIAASYANAFEICQNLIQAASNGDDKTIASIIEAQFKITADQAGQALEKAASYGHPACVTLILQH